MNAKRLQERTCLRRWIAIYMLAMTAGLVFPRMAGAQVDWLILDRPTTRALARLSFIDSLRGWVVGDSGTILRTSDGGANWVQQVSPVPFDILDIDMVDEKSGWAVAQQYPTDTTTEFGTTVLHTTNGGDEWVAQTTFDQFLHTIEFIDSVNGCLGGAMGKLLWTSDGGVTWIPAVVDSPAWARWPIRKIEYYSPDFVLAMGGQYDVTGLIWRSTNGGKFWTHRRVAGEPIFGVHFFDSLNVICTGGDLDFGAGMVRTSTGGEQWQYTYLGIWGQAAAVSFRTPSEGWAPLGFAGTFMYSLDSGYTWTSMYTPDSTGLFDVIFTDSLTGYMVGNNGTILKYAGPSTEVRPSDSGLPLQSTLLQNYPNPFNGISNFGFRVSDFSFVSLRIFDLLGRDVATLVNERLEPGTYTRQWDAAGLPSGVYYYRLQAAGTVLTRKMLLLK